MPVTIYPTTLKYKNSNGQFQSATAIKGDSGEGIVVQVSGTTPTIICEDNHRYICGEILSLNITPPANGVCEIIFESGSTATLLTAPNTIKWPEWFNPNSLETSATYQFKISNGLANVAIWPDEGLTGDTRVRIQKMLGIYEAPWELIREDTFTNAEEADYYITIDGNGNAFELTDLVLLFETPKQATASGKGGSGRTTYYNGDTVLFSQYGATWTQAANADPRSLSVEIINHGGLYTITARGNTVKSASGTLVQSYGEGFTGNLQSVFMSNTFIVTKINITSVTGTGHYKLYGKRKWQ